MPHLIDLPTDILFSIFPYLSAADFLSLTSSSKSLCGFRQDPTFWRVLTRSTFRIPPQPLLQADGARWQWLYKNLLTKTQLFAWGNNSNGSLGLDPLKTNVRWPSRVEVGDEVGVVADVQCGGWSTVLLNSIGVIYVSGVVNGLGSFARINSQSLSFPPSYPPTSRDQYEPSTAIQQLSVGRSHILGLSDNGNVWFWCRRLAYLVQPLDVEMVENKVTRVVAGWDRSSMYIKGVGIVFWAPNLRPNSKDRDLDYISMETNSIPGTAFRRKRNNKAPDSSLEARIGEVTNFVTLEGYIVFTTDLNKIFAYPTALHMSDPASTEPVELTTLYPDSPLTPFQIRDIQGSFRSFAIFTTSGSVLMANRYLIDAVYSETAEFADDPLAKTTMIPALQGGSIVSVSFGDYHFHALHANGTISSHGTECNNCGSLGLGDEDIAKLRGVKYSRRRHGDPRIELEDGRTIWFEPMMRSWLRDMASKSKVGEAQARGLLFGTDNGRASEAMGDYFEREGARWEEGLTGEGELSSYFVLKVSAAGWHSAALVLVDDEKAERARKKHLVIRPPPIPLTAAVGPFESDQASDSADDSPDEPEEGMIFAWVNDPFPRLRMRDGEVMPGEIDVMN